MEADAGYDEARRAWNLAADQRPSAAVLSDNDWATQGRSPYLLETSLPGVFAVGDVRANSVKRVAAAVGEGGMAVRFAQEYLGQPERERSACRVTSNAAS
jgi:thioredoxin reductase